MLAELLVDNIRIRELRKRDADDKRNGIREANGDPITSRFREEDLIANRGEIRRTIKQIMEK